MSEYLRDIISRIDESWLVVKPMRD